jgi:hypothetical protein
MSTIFTAILLIAATAAIVFFFKALNRKNNNKKLQFHLEKMNSTAAAQGLNFSSQEILTNKIIGLDGQHRKLLVQDFLTQSTASFINLIEVKACYVFKAYTEVNFGNATQLDTEQELQAVGLNFDFNNKAPFQLFFYDRQVNSIYEMAELEKKATDWEQIILKLVHSTRRSGAGYSNQPA